jgi:hypothetical protein
MGEREGTRSQAAERTARRRTRRTAETKRRRRHRNSRGRWGNIGMHCSGSDAGFTATATREAARRHNQQVCGAAAMDIR